MRPTFLATTLLPFITPTLGAYNLAKEYSGQSFFQGWDFYGAPDLTTDGAVNWVTEANATAEQLAYVNSAGNAIIKVDNTSFVPYPDKRNAVRITTQDFFPFGSVIIIDATHIPFGCSVWPSFWTKGPNWPDGGEIDIIETINQMQTNQYALHTGGSGCLASNNVAQTGTLGSTNCSSPTGAEPGCTVTESATDAVGQAFASAGGGVYATQLDTTGINIWFWSRANIPSSVSSTASSVDPSTWGKPSASYSSSTCDMTEYFVPQQLVLDITLCGKWAGDPTIYSQTCPVNGTADANTCYYNNVINTNGTNLSDAYFEVSYIKAFTLANATISSAAPSGTSTSNPSSTGSSPATSGTGTAGGSGSTASSGAATVGLNRGLLTATLLMLTVSAML